VRAIPDSERQEAPKKEKPTLDQWARGTGHTPWYRVSTSGSRGSIPGDLTEAVGDADDRFVKSTAPVSRYAERTRLNGYCPRPPTKPAPSLMEDRPEAVRPDALLGKWTLEMNHRPAAIVVDSTPRRKYGESEGVVYSPVAKARQEAGGKVLETENAFARNDGGAIRSSC